MIWKNLFNLEKIRQKFDWTPVAVKAPRTRYEFYRDTGKVLLGYEVEVEYLYHGTKTVLFATDEDKLGLVPRRRALLNAVDFYRATRKRISEYKKRYDKCK